MHILWKYLKPHHGLIAVSLLLAAASQVLALVDPIIFGRIIDDYAIGRADKSDDELIRGVLLLLGLAVLVAVLSRLARAGYVDGDCADSAIGPIACHQHPSATTTPCLSRSPGSGTPVGNSRRPSTRS